MAYRVERYDPPCGGATAVPHKTRQAGMSHRQKKRRPSCCNPAPCPPPVWVETPWAAERLGMNAPITSTKNSARHRCFMLTPNADERGSLDANSYKGGQVFLARTYE